MPSHSVIPIYKPLGMTPLQALYVLQRVKPELHNKTLAYAGRLDPMAEGLLLVLVGDECKKREQYQMLPKTYEVTVLFGFATDTYDALGLITDRAKKLPSDIDGEFSATLPTLIGKFDQAYPPYSSVRVKGKPLFYWAREGLLDTITIPTKSIEITKISLLTSGVHTSEELLSLIIHKIELISGDFRQDKILSKWRKDLTIATQHFPFITIRVNSTHGAYMRSLAHEIGKKIDVPALTLSIKRLSVGEFLSEDALVIPSPAVS